MLRSIRAILSSSSKSKAMKIAGRIVFALYLTLFVSDCINIDVLFAAAKGGDITFLDNPGISDSLFDTGNAHHVSVFDAPVHENDHLKISGRFNSLSGNRMLKNLICEDEDSPGIADAVLSTSFSDRLNIPRPESDISSEGIIQTLDRTISFGQILI